MTRVRIWLFTLLGLSCWPVAASAAAAGRPNIVVILAGDFGYGSANCYGADSALVRTPNIDRLARAGAEMKCFYVSPVCSPTRASVLTGRYNYRTRVVDTFKGRAMMEPAESTLPEVLRAAG